MAQRRALCLVLLIGAIPLLTGCLSGGETPSPSRSQAVTTDGPRIGGKSSEDHDKEVRLADAAMRAFVAHDRGYDEWWADLTQYLGEDAREAYAYTDPANVPASEVTGRSLLSGVQEGMLTVLVPTDIGSYSVELVREQTGGPWVIHRLRPPEDTQ
ncbi:hypothetical protein [Leifsonia sp. ALI-44-B]|uniref:hypothetical protein n=1 Tax=Leifsonia sp. ALI-44-B TaxID=1933776 RepID=UPI00117B363F|nr:hypothetical protein [Leifsonia sp. ALI-44-B]